MNPTNFQRFHNELKAAMVARAPIEIGDSHPGRSSRRLTEAELSKWESVLQPLLADDRSLNQALESDPSFPRRYRAALQVFDQTGSMVPVLDGLATRQIAHRRVTRILRWTFFYLMLVLLVAFYGLWLFDSNIVPTIKDMQADLLLPAAINAPQRIDPLPWLPAIVSVLGIGFVGFTIWLLLGGVKQAARWMGGSHYVNSRASLTAIQTMEMLIASGVKADEAFALSCELAGADPATNQEILNATQGSTSATHLGSLAEYFTILANQRLAYMKVTAPIALISTIGGGVAAIYGMLIFWPIISMLKDLTTAGT